MSEKPDMVKAMDLASMIDAYADVGEPPSLTGPELVNLCRAYLALERQLAEMTRQRDEALREPTTQELINAAQHEFDAFKPDDVLLVALFVTARRKRILGDA